MASPAARRNVAHRYDLDERLYDGRVVRMWEFYLAASETAFAMQNMMMFQIRVTKRQGAAPITRDDIGAEDARPRICASS